MRNNTKGQNDLLDIDVAKAFTSSLASISEIPIFNEFDNFQPYDANQEIRDLNLYVVEEANHGLKTATRSFRYGRYLRGTERLIAVKRPSFIKQVDYRKATYELYKTKISEDQNEDMLIKKLIANVNIGLLEKCFNKKTKGYLFRDKSECQRYQAMIGGTIHRISKIEDCIELGIASDLDEGIPEFTVGIYLKKSVSRFTF